MVVTDDDDVVLVVVALLLLLDQGNDASGGATRPDHVLVGERDRKKLCVREIDRGIRSQQATNSGLNNFKV